MRMEIDLDKVGIAKNALLDDTQKFKNIVDRVTSIKNNCPFSGRDRQGLVTSLNNTLLTINNQKSTYQKWANCLDTVKSTYVMHENKSVYGNMNVEPVEDDNSNVIDPIHPGKQGLNIDYLLKELFKIDNLWKIIAGGGMLGNVVSAFGTLMTNEHTPKNITSVTKYVNSAFGKLLDAYAKKSNGSGDWYKGLIGMNNAYSKIDTSSFWKAFTSYLDKEVSDLSMTGASTVAEKGKVLSKWAGYALTFIANGFENYDEFKESEDWARATGETVVESTVDILMGIGAGALVTAGLATAGVAVTAGLPALVVAAGSAVVVMGANAVCKWVTGGKDIGEVAADAVYDLGNYLSDLGSTVGNAIKGGVKSAWSSICGVFA